MSNQCSIWTHPEHWQCIKRCGVILVLANRSVGREPSLHGKTHIHPWSVPIKKSSNLPARLPLMLLVWLNIACLVLVNCGIQGLWDRRCILQQIMRSSWLFNSLAPGSYLNPLCAKFFRGNINLYLHFVSFLHIDMTQVVEFLPQITQEPTYCT